MFTLSITPTGTVDTVRSQHDTLRDARHALVQFARGYDLQTSNAHSGTLTVRTGRVNQAAYAWNIR
jgi:hypothetical protein